MKSMVTEGKTQDSPVKIQQNPLRDLTSQNMSTGVIAASMAITGPTMIILQAAANGGYSQEQTISWVFAINFFGGLLSLYLPLTHRIPVVGASTLSGVAFLATVTSQFTFAQMVGGFVMSGILIFLIGISGAFTFIMKWVPREVIAAMLAGMVTSYVVRMVTSIQALPVVGFAALASYLLLMKWGKRIPPVVGAVFVSILTLLFTQGIHITSGGSIITWPVLTNPEFSVFELFSLSIPLCILILSNDAVPAIGALQTYAYSPPMNRIITASGVTSILAGFFGGQSANVAGLMTAVCSDNEAGAKHQRYMASVVSGIWLMLFGVFASITVPFIQALPAAMVPMLIGFGMIGVLGTSLQSGFSDSRYRLAAIFAFVIAMSQVSFLHISAPVWSLVIGSLIAKAIGNSKN
jgi:benzoate membrane transport protein